MEPYVSSSRLWRPLSGLVMAIVMVASPVAAQQVRQTQQPANSMTRLTVRSPELAASQPIEPLDGARAAMSANALQAWTAFRGLHAEWQASVDQRTGLLASALGPGIPWVPGRGNSLTPAEVPAKAGGGRETDLSTLEARARAEIERLAPLLGVDNSQLRLDQGSSGHPADHLWVIDFDVVLDGLALEGAHVVFRVNNGNLIELGSEYLPTPGSAVPPTNLDREKALAVLSRHVGGLTAADELSDPGSLHLLPANVGGPGATDYAAGQGRRIVKVWQFVLRRRGVIGTFRARVDATTGKLLAFEDVNQYGAATGGIAADSVAGTETTRPLPFLDLGGGVFANSAGSFAFSGTPLTSVLNGQFIRVIDNCGAISNTTDVAGNLGFSTAGGSNCATPGLGGAGNTRSTRTSFYHLNRGKEIARGWLPANAFLNAQFTANVNRTGTCNGYWNFTGIDLFRAMAGSCGASGEEPGFILHELGHGIDQNDGTPLENTSEAYADVNAVVVLHNSCVGPGFWLSNCTGYGDACIACTGLREVDFARHASNTPATVSNFTQVRCGGGGGPCGREVHCEAHVATEAIWDFANRDLPSPGSSSAWAVLERLWFLSRSSSTTGFSCTPGPTFTSNGCNAGSWWRAMRAVDDDDGNLANGTPHGGALFAAFNRHGIACASDPGAGVTFAGCTPPPVPTLAAAGGNDTVAVTVAGAGGAVFDIFRNEIGCNAGFVKITGDFPGGTFIDNAVTNGNTYFYQAVAHPVGNAACASPPSACQSVKPTAAPQIQVPGDLAIGATCIGASGTGTLNVCNTGKTDLIVTVVTSSNAEFAVTTPSAGFPVTISHDFCFPFRVTLQPTAVGARSALLTIASNDPLRPSVPIAVTGDGTERNVAVTGATDFGVASAWRPAERTLAVCNTGGCPLTVSAATVGCADFTLVQNPFPAAIPAGSCLDLVARFTPVLPGRKSCTLSIASDDPDTPVVNRTLTARTPPFVSLHAGLSQPHGALSGSVRQGSAFQLDFVYDWRPRWAWDVRLRSARFDGRPCCDDVELSAASANVKYTLTPGAPVRVFLNGGLGLYHFNPGDVEGGGNLGLGINVPLAARRFALELAYNYDSAFTASPNLKFSQVQLGLLISF